MQITNPKIIALIAFRDEEKHLPGLFSHLRNYVDGFIGFDDCSNDKSHAIARAEPKMVQLLERKVLSADHHFEIQNRQALLQAAHEHGTQWVLCCDADERFETRFLERLRELIKAPPATIMGLPLVAVWENFQQHRVGNARKYVLFPTVDPQPYYPPGMLHQQWFPPHIASKPKVFLDYYIYHLGSLTRADRMARFEKFNRIDPELKQQPQGYKGIIDESDLVLAPIAPERAFRYE